MEGSIGHRNGQPLGQSLQAGDGRAQEREFGRARRHTRLVRSLRVGLPVVAGLIVLAGLAVTWFARALPVDVAFASTSIVDGRLVMEDPRLSGVDGNDRPYSMIADRAIQALGGSGIDLETVRASLSVDPETTAELTAAKGRFDTTNNMLRLYDQIAVDTSSGIKIRLDSADVHLNEGRLMGNGPVEISTPSQRLEAGNVSISEGGKTLSFGNRVKLTLLPQTRSNPEAGPAAQASESTP
ncbi:LPS export ABC transporter periplasmic protein LptC [Aureimonas jatrophae]|uniref:Lipopolysaccharide export system protein LptC n=1 Tax=Aureimonas jatrophae TaxID=1166073 RepID=A0A1H0IMC8_9HYPH|nr:LPS export ABC transporter periplasmic protein LptC [Aureimonas jatrophae]MBB3952254.1 lipopolysaccharide export system protein LptC [Aureimonas jatrophae]SDO32552.1 lipopolysaccharide export system protein LptC [Aureimonas jatrophae]